jgi:signal recognition particle receptor subunit beta
LKIVYYGPALSGKTTNLQAMHYFLNDENRSRLMVLNTQDDRTLFFDLLPMRVRTASGLAVKLKIYTVPGQVIHNTTRKLVLAGVDAIAFIADSQRSLGVANSESWNNMVQNLRENRIDPRDIPVVLQFNKRDLPDVKPDEEIIAMRMRGNEPVYTAIGTEGQGVCETFFGLLSRRSLSSICTPRFKKASSRMRMAMVS